MVYIALFGAESENEAYMKVGITTNWKSRRKQFKTNNPLFLRRAYGLDVDPNLSRILEKTAFTAFDQYHHTGEWFKFNRDEWKILSRMIESFMDNTELICEYMRNNEEWETLKIS